MLSKIGEYFGLLAARNAVPGKKRRSKQKGKLDAMDSRPTVGA